MSGVQLEATQDVGGGQNVGYIDQGDWMEYQVKVTQAATYQFAFRVASIHFGAQMSVLTGSTTVATVSIPNTGNWQGWTTIATLVTLASGEYTIRLHSDNTAGWNVNWIEIALPTAPPTAPPSSPITSSPAGSGGVTISGEQRQWHKVTLSLNGPYAEEGAGGGNNPFLDYRMDVTFSGGGETLVVPGYFAADGNAKETSATTGNVWRAHLSPSKTGTYTYSISFRQGSNIAVSLDRNAGSPLAPHNGKGGSFLVDSSNKVGRDFRADNNGRLIVVGERNLKYSGSNKYFVKAGADSPETLLAFQDFDGTSGSGIKSWAPHAGDWQHGDPTWKGGKGKGLIGAVNYIAGTGCNVMSFLTYNVGGDGDNVWPHSSKSTRTSMDVSKLDQWEAVFEHMTKKGIYLHFKTQETENDNGPNALDGGAVGTQRKLYYRELIARFSHHLALNWNLGEENSQTLQQQREMAAYFKATDPYSHLVVIHTFGNEHDKVYGRLLDAGSDVRGASLQTHWNRVHADTLKWVLESAQKGTQWVVSNDEQGGYRIGIPGQGDDGPSRRDLRHHVLWGNLLAGGGGIESYFGYETTNTDLDAESFKNRADWWAFCAHALDFFNSNVMTGFVTFANCDALTSVNVNWCFGKQGDTYVVYMPTGTNSGSINLRGEPASTSFTVTWYNPRSGTYAAATSVIVSQQHTNVNIGNAPDSEDWVAVIRT